MTAAQETFGDMVDRILAERLWGEPLEAAILFGEELLVRYPALQENVEFLLPLAYLQALASVTQSTSYPTTTFYEALAMALNTNQVQPSQLDEWLAPYGFVIAAQLAANNLFGDGQPAQVLHIEAMRQTETMRSPTTGVVVVLSGASPGHYRLTPLRQTWLAYYLTATDEGEVITVADRNGNGRADIASIVTRYGHATCNTEFSLYEWQGNREQGAFSNIAPIPLLWSDYIDYGCADVWHFSPPGPDGRQSVIRQINYHHAAGDDCTGFQWQQVYSWDGATYVFAADGHLDYDERQPDRCRAGWATHAPAALAILVFEPVQDHWLPEYNSWGAASQDWLLFKLGIWYALAGQPAAAKTILERLATDPPTPQYTIIPRLAAAFLAAYQSPADVYAACTAVIQTAQADLDAHPRSSDYVGLEMDRIAALWGFFDRRWVQFTSLDVLCDRFPAFAAALTELDAASAAEIETWAQEHQIPLFVLAHHDFSADGQADWLVAVQERVLWSLYLFIRDGDRITAVPFSSARFEADPLPAQFETFSLDSGTAYLVQAGEELVVFQVEALQVNVLLSTWGIVAHTLLPAAAEIQILVESKSGAQRIYTWHDASQTFELPPQTSPAYEQAMAIREIRQMLFVSPDAPTAVTLLETLLSGGIIEQGQDVGLPLVRPRLLYLLGLAYELSHRETEALHTYWQLWQEYPDNAYTRLAISRLEPVAP